MSRGLFKRFLRSHLALRCVLVYALYVFALPCFSSAQSATPKSATPKSATAQSATPKRSLFKTPTISVEQHRAELSRALRQLRAWQKGALPSDKKLSAALPTEDERFIKRRDGATQKISGHDWSRALNDIEYSNYSGSPNRVSRRTVRDLEALFVKRLQALDDWTKSAYVASDAQQIVRSLESSNQISTAPPRFLVWWQAAKDAIGDFFTRLFSWRTPPAPRTPNAKINPTWITFFFASTLAALLVAVAWWLWRTFGGNWTRKTARREVLLSGEDAELLLLPPDELRARAARLANEGHFAQALRHRYVAILLSFDGWKVWRYDTRRTNWEHIVGLRKSRATQNLVAPLSSLTERFDRVRYGEMICNFADWTRFDSDAKMMESLASSAMNNGNEMRTSSTRSAEPVARDASHDVASGEVAP